MTTLFRDAVACGATGVLGAVLAASGAAILADSRPHALWGAAASPSAVEGRVALTLAACGLAVLLWWLLAWCAAFAAAVLLRSGRTAAARRLAPVSPATMRRVAAAVVGAQLALAPAAQAHVPFGPQPSVSEPSTVRPPASWQSASQPAVSGLSSPATPGDTRADRAAPDEDGARPPDPGWRPERPAAPLDRILGGGTDRGPVAGGREVVVLAGDSLWSIADRNLGGVATDAEIAREWPRWYQANREAIGADPDLLAVGTVLRAPTA